MTNERVDIVDRVTGQVVDYCRGPSGTGACPRAGSGGVVACADRRIAPLNGDPAYWMLWVAPTSRHCLLAWTMNPGVQAGQLANDHERAVFCRRRAEACRDEWFDGRMQEIAYVKARFAARDRRFKNMTEHQLEMTGRWRWSQSPHARHLADDEQRYSQWARAYLSFAKPGPHDHRERPD